MPTRELFWGPYIHPIKHKGSVPPKKSLNPTTSKKENMKSMCLIWGRLEVFSCILSSLSTSTSNQLPACCCGNQAILLHPAKAAWFSSLGEWSCNCKWSLGHGPLGTRLTL